MPFDYGDDNLNTGLYEFPTFFSGNTGDLTTTSTGSGVHLFKDIRIQLDVLDRDENNYNDEGSFLSSAFTSKFQIDIIDISGNDIKTGYLTDYKNPFFTFNEVENIDVFGDYAKHFGVRTKLIAQDDLESQSEFYFYGNIPAISGVAVKDGTGTTFHTGSSSDKSGVNSTGQTGQVSLTVTFDNDMSYVKMKELDVFITTGSGFDIEEVDATLFPSYTQPINQLGIQTFPIDETKFDANSGDYYFHLVPHSEIGSGVSWTVGPNRIVKQPIDRSPFATTDEAVLVYGEQTASGNKFFRGETMTFGGVDHDVVPLTTGNTIAGGRANSITGDTPAFNFIGGGSGNIVFDSDYSVVVGGEEDDISGGAYNFIGGGKDIDITGSNFSSSIGGFNNDILDANSSIIAGGQNNLITGTGSVSSFLGGGQDNTVERSAYSVVVGGTGNLITGDDSQTNVIGGGSSNTIAGAFTSTIAGGSNNTITGIVGGASFIGGGTNNNINNATSSVIAGGISNEIKSGSRFSVIAGGFNNDISGEYSSILGGEDHILRGDDSAILAGTDHQVYATGSFIAGAKDSITSGENSYILGRKGSIPESHSGAAVFADGQDRVHASSGEHTAVLDFASGVYIESQSGLYVNGSAVLTSETDDQTLDEVLTQGNTSSENISVGAITGSALTIDTDTLYVDSANDRVGIGTTSPVGKLHVDQPDNDEDALVLKGGGGSGSVQGNVSLSMSHFATDTNPAVRIMAEERNNADYRANLLFLLRETSSDVAPTEKMRITYDGKVGIGTTSPSEKLEVLGQAIINGGTGVASAGTLHVRQKGNTSSDGITLTSGNATSHRIWKDANGKLNFGPSVAASSFVQDLSGNIGIGTTSPDYRLDIGGDTSSTSNTLRMVQGSGGTAIRIGAGGSGNDVTLLRVDGNSSANLGESDSGAFGFSLRYKGSGSGNNNSLAFFSDNQTSGTQVEALTIAQDGKIGIGTTTPLAPLQIASGTTIPITNAPSGSISFCSISSATTSTILGRQTANRAGLYLASATTNANSAGDMVFNVRENNNTAFSTLTNTAFRFQNFTTDLLRILRNGNVGIGTTAPSEKLHVDGKILADNLFSPQWVTPITLGACPTYTAGSGTVTNEGRGVGLASGATATDEAAVKLERYFACGRGSGQSTRFDYWNTIVGVSFTRTIPDDTEFFIEIGTNGVNSPVGPPSDTDEGVFFTLKRVSGSYTFDLRHNRGSAADNTTSLGNSTSMNISFQYGVEIRTLTDGTLQLYINNAGYEPTLHTEWTGLTFGQNGGANDNNVWVGFRSIGRTSGVYGVGATKAYLGYWR